MAARIYTLCLLLCMLQLIHAAPSPSRELDIVLVPKQPKLPFIIFEFKDNSKSQETEDTDSSETSTSTSTSAGTTTTDQPNSLEESLSKETDAPVVTRRPKFNFTRSRSRRAISSDEISTTEGPDDYSDEQNYTSTSTTTEGPVSGELVVASQENDDADGVTITRISMFRIIAVPYNSSGNSSEESQDDDTTSTTASSVKGNFQVHHLRKRQAGGYGASEDDHSGHAREFAPEALSANVTAPTYVGESPAPTQTAAGSTPAPSAAGPAGGSTPAPAVSTAAPPAVVGSTPAPAGSTPPPSTAPVSASASAASSPSTSSASASNGTTTVTAQAGAPTTVGTPSASSTPAGSGSTPAAAVGVTTVAGPSNPPPAPESLTAAGSSPPPPPPLLCGPPPPDHSQPPPPPPPSNLMQPPPPPAPSNLMQPTTSAPASAQPVAGSGRGLGYSD